LDFIFLLSPHLSPLPRGERDGMRGYSFDILYLFPNLFKFALDLDHPLRDFRIIGFRTDGVDLPMDLLE
jgi:hypothetical protein